MVDVPFDVDQIEWGSMKSYGDGGLSGYFDPLYLLIHWGGTTRQVVDEAGTLRAWQRYHIGVKGMRDIAYSYAVGDSGTIYRLRGLNPNGSNKQTLIDPASGKPWNNVTVAVVWIGGANDDDGPSDAAYASLQRITDQTGLPLVAHSDMKATACPGDDWRRWITNYQPSEDDMTYEQFAADEFDLWTDTNIMEAWEAGMFEDTNREGFHQWWVVERDDRTPTEKARFITDYRAHLWRRT